MISQAHKDIVRDAVADFQKAAGLETIAERTRAGEMDQLPMMQAAFFAVGRVLESLGR